MERRRHRLKQEGSQETINWCMEECDKWEERRRQKQVFNMDKMKTRKLICADENKKTRLDMIQ